MVKDNTHKPVLVVTGGSRGIGAAIAITAAANGYNVCINYKSDKASAENVSSQAKTYGVECITVQADVSQENEVVRLFETVDAQLGAVTALVNNVGILMNQATVVELSAERINKVLTTNVTSYFLCSREAVLRMSTDHGGSGGAIVNISSVASRLGSPREYVDYAASKAAVDTLTIGLAREVATQGIRVNAIRPGLIYTDIHADSGEPDRVNRLASGVPMARGGKPEEVADAVQWLLGDKASYVTGTFIEVAGGR